MGQKASDLRNKEEVLGALMANNRQLLRSLANPDQTIDPSLNFKLIHLVVVTKNVGALQSLLENKVTDVNIRAAHNLTALHLAAMSSTPEIVSLLLKKRELDVNAVEENHRTPLMLAVTSESQDRPRSACTQIVELIASDRRCRIEHMDPDNYSALTYAARIGNVEAAKILLAGERSSKYAVNELLGDYVIARKNGHEAVGNAILSSLAPSQLVQIKAIIDAMKGASETKSEAEQIFARMTTQKAAGDLKAVTDSNGQTLKVGSMVSIISDKPAVRLLQRNHGGYSEDFDSLIDSSLPGRISRFDGDGDARVDFLDLISEKDGTKCINPKALKLRSKDDHQVLDHEGNLLKIGDLASARRGTVNEQWAEKPGIVKYFDHDGDPVLVIAGKPKCFKADSLCKITKVECKNGAMVAIGMKVKVDVSPAQLKQLQTDQFGGSSSSMEEACGSVFTLQAISVKIFFETPNPQCVVRISDSGKSFWINPKTLTPVNNTENVGPVSQALSTGDASERNEFQLISPDDLKLERKLGAGAFGTVFLSKWSATTCAVKEVKAGDLIAGAEKDRILQEAKIHSRLIHPHIVQFLGIALERTTMLIVLKLVNGFNLEEALFEGKMELTPSEKLCIATQVCDVIRYLHESAKVVHQDIKPSNIMIETVSKNAMITDFGISRLANHSMARTLNTVTQAYTTSLAGTLLYMGPELLIPDKGAFRKATFLSDIYSLGATLAEMFGGVRVFGPDIKDMADLLNRKLSREMPFAIKKCPEQHQIILRKCMDKTPDMRPSCTNMVLHFVKH